MTKGKKIIIAHHIEDLTLARYFASKDIDLIILNLDTRNLAGNKEFIAQLMLWIEGPKLAGTGSDPEMLDSLERDLAGIARIIARKDLYALNGKIKPEVIAQWLEFDNSYPDPIPAQISYSDGHHLSPEDRLASIIVIRANGEEKTGIYDFSVMEDFFDQLTSEA
ncbi:MAG: hypothetical protein K1X68_13445 [Saprospiraceae bacterium]|nr:hypothetical protein [Saprospiraceae bacterium]HMW39719.1 hypothetical protein [Saprospiraceae bacterium]HMX89419.1 hypothetical protein [Saprospiraceae bacterium]HMZ40069.1 hypothetical protein [Saprospiraceae bacterium]HNA64809.1 hypothetical protein [Saprospiraceae bacterium]